MSANIKTGLSARAGLTLGALGVVYGDIGTSPIYAFNESVHAGGHSEFAIMGILSLIFWTLVLVVSLKYLIFVLRADNKGEGGILALFALLPSRIKTAQKGKFAIIVFLVLVAAAFLFADGILTPAISVVSAMEGLKNINPAFEGMVLPATVAILGALFAVQFKGTLKIGRIFGPVMLVWFLIIGALGFNQIAQNTHVLQALNPAYAIGYITEMNWQIFVVLASVILAVAGAEALYADLGHFGKSPIRIGWFGIAGLSLVLCYFGQAALVLRDETAIGNAFFGLAGDGFGKIALLLAATFATVVASQALISGVASIASQAIHLTLVPRMKINQTNSEHKGQIYIPVINALLAAGSIALVLVFKSSAALAGAYTFAISGTMLITTICIYWVALEIWKMKKWILYPVFVFFVILDLAFLVATSTKIMTGAWLPLVLGVGLAMLMWTWRKGRIVLGKEMNRTDMSLSELEQLVKSKKITQDKQVGVYLSAKSDLLPQSLEVQVRQLKHLPEKVIIVSVVPIDEPHSSEPPTLERVNSFISKVTIKNGFMEARNIPELLNHESMKTHFNESEAMYYLTDRTLTRKQGSGLNPLEESVFISLHRNASKASSFFKLPSDRVVSFDVKLEL